MITTGQYLSQRQALQQRLSPQQIQYIKLLQLPAMALEMRVKEELEINPVLEEIQDTGDFSDSEIDENPNETDSGNDEVKDESDYADDDREIDWDSFSHDQDSDYYSKARSSEDESWREYPKPYHENLLEDLEKQVGMLELNETERNIAEQILGSIDEDGYLRRELRAIIDAVAFNTGKIIHIEHAEKVLNQIQRLDPPGIASRNLRECLLVQLEVMPSTRPGRTIALKIVQDEWENFEKKHFDKISKKLYLSDDDLKSAYDCIQSLDPKPGYGNEQEDVSSYITPDFAVYFQPNDENNDSNEGEYIINLNSRNVPSLRISPQYKKMWDELKQKKKKSGQVAESQQFIRTKIESAKWFIDSIRQRQDTLLSVMSTIVALQEYFFRYGEKLRPMILKDVADRVHMDISTISRVVNGKFVQTPFGVFELKYFFNEGIETSSGGEVSNREVKNYVQEIVQTEDKKHPLSDDAIADELNKKGYVLARRTISKYREQLGIPVARLRKEVI